LPEYYYYQYAEYYNTPGIAQTNRHPVGEKQGHRV
jgi:hypothetical protein